MKAQNLWRAAEALSATAKASGVSLKECEILLRPRSHGTGAVVDTHWANGETTCQALHALRERYPGRPLVLIWDNVRYHHALLVRRCAQDLGIQLRYLPPYSPDLMPVERLLQWLRQQLTALHCHRDEEELRDRVAGFEAQANDDTSVVHCRLRPKTWLDPARGRKTWV